MGAGTENAIPQPHHPNHQQMSISNGITHRFGDILPQFLSSFEAILTE